MTFEVSNKMQHGVRIAAAATLVALVPLGAQASVVFSIQQVGANVLVTGSGSYNLTGATNLGGGAQAGFLNPTGGLAVGGPFQTDVGYLMTANGGPIGSGGLVNGSSDIGDVFGLDWLNGYITVYQGYVSGTALSGSTTFASSTFATLGLTAGTYTYRIANDSITVYVPEPGSVALAGLGLAAALLTRRRQRAG